MELFKEMEVNYKDFIESANDFMNSCREYKNINEIEDKKIYIQFGEILSNKRWEDKIKAKIEELEKDFKEYENGQEWEIQDEIRGQIDVLQSLLEKCERK